MSSDDPGLDAALGPGLAPDEGSQTWRFGVLYSLFWPRGRAIRSQRLATYNRFCDLLPPELGGRVSVVVGKGTDGEQFLRRLRDRAEAAGVAVGLETHAAPSIPVQGIAGEGFSLSGALAWTANAVTIAEEGVTFEAGQTPEHGRMPSSGRPMEGVAREPDSP